MHDNYFEYIFSDEYLASGYNNINESFENNLYINEEKEFMNIPFNEFLPAISVCEGMSNEDLVLLESAYIQHEKALYEFMGNGTHLYGNQIGVGATDWVPKVTNGLSGPLKWLASLIAGTLAGLLGLLGALIKKGKQQVGLALLKRYITKIAAITDEGYKNICGLFTSPRNRACFRTFQEASERDIIVSVDVCAKALGLLDNTLAYDPEDQNPFKQSEDLISDIHNTYLKDIVTSRGFFGFNKLIEKPQEKIDNTNDYAEKYNIKIRNAFNLNQMSNHQSPDYARESENWDPTQYNSLNEYKDEPEHYGSTENYAKNLDAYLVAARAAWENLCKRLIGEVRIGEEVDYLNKNKELNIKSTDKKTGSSIPLSKFKQYLSANPPEDDTDIEEWTANLIKAVYRKDDNKVSKIMRDFPSPKDPKIVNIWAKICRGNRYYIKNQTPDNLKDIWENVDKHLLRNIRDDINESLKYNPVLSLNERSSDAEGIISWRDEDIDNNLILQMSNFIQRVTKDKWKITIDFKKKCTELAAAVDNEIITKINRWTTPGGAPGRTGQDNKGYNSPITKAGLEKLWKAYKEELNNRIEQRVYNFTTSKPFDYALQFLQFTVPSLMKDVLNKVDPENVERKHLLSYNYESIKDIFSFGEVENGDNISCEINNWESLDESQREIIIKILNRGSAENESFISWKGFEFKLFEDEEIDDSDINDNLDDPENNDATDDSDINDNGLDDEEENSQTPPPVPSTTAEDSSVKMLIDGYSVLFGIVETSQLNDLVLQFNSDLKNLNYLKPGENTRDIIPCLKTTVEEQSVLNGMTLYNNIPFKQVYVNFEDENKVFPESVKNDGLILDSSYFGELKEYLINNAESSTNSIDAKQLVFFKLPIYYYGNNPIIYEIDIKPEWVKQDITGNSSNVLNEFLNDSSNNLDNSGLSVYWPLTQDEIQNNSFIETEEKPEETEDDTDDSDISEDETNESYRLAKYWEKYYELYEDEATLSHDLPSEGDENKTDDKEQQSTALVPVNQDDNKSDEQSHNKPSSNSDNKPKTLGEVGKRVDDARYALIKLDIKIPEKSGESKNNVSYSLNENLQDKHIAIVTKDIHENILNNKVKMNITLNPAGKNLYKLKYNPSSKTVELDPNNKPQEILYDSFIIEDLEGIIKAGKEKFDIGYIQFKVIDELVKQFNNVISLYTKEIKESELPEKLEAAIELNINGTNTGNILADNLNKYKGNKISSKEILIKNKQK